jgi:5-(carboxyamino)imidazole ribonucleotide synthase
MIIPGKTIGVLGGGQLGRMFTVAAITMGYEVVVLDPDPHSPAGPIAHYHIQKSYKDKDALRELCTLCKAVTTEFENVPADTMAFLADHITVRPSAKAVSIAQDRRSEKQFLNDNHIPTNKFHIINHEDQIIKGLAHVGTPAILKRAQLGYDGKGQYEVHSEMDAVPAFRAMNHVPCILEERLDFKMEISVLLARGYDDSIVFYPPAENAHDKGILDMSVIPARIPKSLMDKACVIGETIARNMDYCGVMAIEMFVMPDDRILVNEIAPRPHNSGHYTIDACVTNQFQQQVRTLCGLPLGDTRLLTPAVMVNFLGDIWKPIPKWEEILKYPNVHLHLYGKKEPRPGRKMGHFTCLHEDINEAIGRAVSIKKAL